MGRKPKRDSGRRRAHKEKKRKERAERLRRARHLERAGGRIDRGWEVGDELEPVSVGLGRYEAELVLRRVQRDLGDAALEDETAMAEALAAVDLAELAEEEGDDEPSDEELAQVLAFEALAALEAGLLREADERSYAALRHDPGCTDARILRLPFESEGPEEGYRTLVEVVSSAEERLGAETIEAARGRAWRVARLRPYLRALHALATVAGLAGLLDESIAAGERLLELAPEDPLEHRFPLIAQQLGRGRLDEAAAQLDASGDEHGAAACWSRALLRLLRDEREEASAALAGARRANAEVESFLLGELILPPEPPESGAPGSDDEAAAIAFHLAPAWRAAEGALEWLDAEPDAEDGPWERPVEVDVSDLGAGWQPLRASAWWRRAEHRHYALLTLRASALELDSGGELDLRCRRRPQRKPCRGDLIAARSVDGHIIGWACKSCDERGFVSGWEPTFLGEARAFQEEPLRDDPDTLRVELSANERAALLESRELYERTWAQIEAAPLEGERYVLRGRAEDLEALLGAATCALHDAPATFLARLEERLRAALGRPPEPTRSERRDVLVLHAAGRQRDDSLPRSSPHARLVAELAGIEPPIRRELTLPHAARLDQLHTILQLAFGWDRKLPHEFQSPEESRALPSQLEAPLHPIESRARLSTLLPEADAVASYVLGRGDEWRVELRLAQLLPEAPPCVALTDGSGALPPQGREPHCTDPTCDFHREADELPHRQHLVDALNRRFWGEAAREPGSTD